MIRVAVLLVLASLTALPLAAAAAPASSIRHWAIDEARVKGEIAAQAHGAIACALGDVDADGARDLLMRAAGDAGGELRALAGPDFTRVLWSAPVDAAARLACAPDVAGDGIADPLIEIVGSASSAAPGGGVPVDASSASATLQALSGATGSAFVDLHGEEGTSGGGASAATGSTRTDVALEPGGAGLYLFVAHERTEASASLLEGLGLSGGDANARIEVIDAAGELVGTIEAPEAEDVLAYAAIVEDAKARILLLTAAEASAIDQLPAQVPTVSAYAADGTLEWTTSLDATAGITMLVPRAGDINADGVEDLIVQSVPADMGLEGASALAVLSGADGAVLLTRATQAGFLGALPLGDLTPALPDDADALLVLAQQAAGELQLECLREGASCWTATLPADAVPVGGLHDAFTGDLAGFHDLTGDGVPDIGALVEGETGSALQMLSGADGKLAWSADVAADARIQPIARASGGADLAVLAHADGAREFALSLLNGVDGATIWSRVGEVAPGISDPRVGLDAAEDPTGAVDMMLLSVQESAPASAPATMPAEHAYVLDPADGTTRWSGSTQEGGASPPPLEPPAWESSDAGAKGVPGAPVALVAALVGLAAVLARRRR